MKEDIFERLRDAAPSALTDEPVVFAYLFGSHATGRTHPRSDVDLAVYLDDSVPEREYLDASLRLAVRLSDASRAGDIEVLILNAAPLPLVGRAIRDRKVVYSRDEPFRARFESLKLRLFLDFEIHAKPLNRELLRAIAEGRR